MFKATQIIGFAGFTEAAAASAFDPGDVAGLQFWVRSDTGVSGASAVSAWADRSGNNRVISETTNSPTLVSADLNGFNAIKFDGSNDQLRGQWPNLAQPSTIYAVVKLNAFGNPGGVLAGGGVVSTEIITRGAPNLLVGDTNVADGAAVSAAVSAYVLVRGVFNSASSWIRINNQANASSATNFTSPWASGMCVGSRNGAQFGAVSVVEIAQYDSVVCGASDTSLLSYFSNRYGIF